MSTTNPMLTPREAARIIGVSYPSIKQWILSGKLKTVQTPGGHHRIAHSTLKPFLQKDKARSAASSRERFRRVSGRNQLAGTVLEVTIEGLLAKIVIAIGKQRITAIITSDAARELALKPGDQALALIKATEVMIGKP